MAAHACLQNEFMEDEKCHNLMSWLKCKGLKAYSNAHIHSCESFDWKSCPYVLKTGFFPKLRCTEHFMFILPLSRYDWRTVEKDVKPQTIHPCPHVQEWDKRATILLKQPIFIKCWRCHRNKAPWQQNSFILKGKSATCIKEKYSYSNIWVMTLSC